MNYSEIGMLISAVIIEFLLIYFLGFIRGSERANKDCSNKIMEFIDILRSKGYEVDV